MIDKLKEWNCIDYQGILMMKCKELEISSEECLVLLYILRFTNMDITITPTLLLQFLTFDAKTLDSCLTNLIKSEYIINQSGCIELGILLDRLISNKSVASTNQDINLVNQFENEFARPLTPIELSVLQEWKQNDKYDDKTIILALKEAVKSNVIKFRYIETILENWIQHGVSSRFSDSISVNESNVSTSEFEWWNDDKK